MFLSKHAAKVVNNVFRAKKKGEKSERMIEKGGLGNEEGASHPPKNIRIIFCRKIWRIEGKIRIFAVDLPHEKHGCMEAKDNRLLINENHKNMATQAYHSPQSTMRKSTLCVHPNVDCFYCS